MLLVDVPGAEHPPLADPGHHRLDDPIREPVAPSVGTVGGEHQAVGFLDRADLEGGEQILAERLIPPSIGKLGPRCSIRPSEEKFPRRAKSRASERPDQAMSADRPGRLQGAGVDPNA